MRDVRVQARNPSPISASVLRVIARMIDVLPLCTLPSSQTTGASARAPSITALLGASCTVPLMDSSRDSPHPPKLGKTPLSVAAHLAMELPNQ
jgi:hypothetical protein